MTQLLGRDLIARANSGLILGTIGSGLALCAFGGLVYDVGRWLYLW
jgi:hypothetical protein